MRNPAEETIGHPLTIQSKDSKKESIISPKLTHYVLHFLTVSWSVVSGSYKTFSFSVLAFQIFAQVVTLPSHSFSKCQLLYRKGNSPFPGFSCHITIAY